MKFADNITISPNAVARDLDGETVILHLDSGQYFGLEPVGARIWELIKEGKNLAAVCEVMLVEYDVSREELERDVSALINDLAAQGIISLS